VTTLGAGCPDFEFSLQHRLQTGSGVHPASSPVGMMSSFPGDKAAGE